MTYFGFNFVDEASRLEEFARAEDFFQSYPGRAKLYRARYDRTNDPVYVAHSYIKHSNGELYCLSHEDRTHRFYMMSLLDVTEVNCFVWYRQQLYYISSDGHYQIFELKGVNELSLQFEKANPTNAPMIELSSEQFVAFLKPHLVAYHHRNRFLDGAFLGEGGFGHVKFAMNKQGTFFALKITTRRMKEEAFFASELGVLQGDAIKIINKNQEAKYYYFFDYLGSDLSEGLQKCQFDFIQKLSLSSNLCLDLARTHQHNVAHGDVKPSNVVVNAQHNPRLIDFGLSSIAHIPVNSTAGSLKYFPSICSGIDDKKMMLLLLQRYSRVELDVIALRKTLHQTHNANLTQRVFSNEEYAFLSKDACSLLNEFTPISPDSLSVLSAALNEQTVFSLQETMENLVAWKSTPKPATEDQYRKIMRHFCYVLATKDMATWHQLFELFLKTRIIHQRNMLVFFTYQLRLVIFQQSDPTFILNTISRLKLKLQEALFVETDQRGFHVGMLAIVYSCRFAHVFWRRIQLFDRVTQGKIHIACNDLKQNSLMLTLILSLTSVFNLINIRHLDPYDQMYIFSQKSTKNESVLTLCLRYYPEGALEVLDIISKLDKKILHPICMHHASDWGSLMLGIAFAPHAVPRLLDIMETLSLHQQYTVVTQLQHPKYQSILVSRLAQNPPYFSQMLAMIQRLNVALQTTLFKFIGMDVVVPLLQKNGILLHFAENDTLGWCGFLSKMSREHAIAILFCLSSSNLRTFTLAANKWTSEIFAILFSASALIERLEPSDAFALLEKPNMVALNLQQMAPLFNFMQHYPRGVIALLKQWMMSTSENNVFIEQSASLAAQIYETSRPSLDEFSYSGCQQHEPQLIERYNQQISSCIEGKTPAYYCFQLLFTAFDFYQIKQLAEKNVDETTRQTLFNLYESLVAFFSTVKLTFLQSSSFDEEQKSHVRQTCYQQHRSILRAMPTSTSMASHQTWRYVLNERIKWIKQTIEDLTYTNHASLGLFTHKRPLDTDNDLPMQDEHQSKKIAIKENERVFNLNTTC